MVLLKESKKTSIPGKINEVYPMEKIGRERKDDCPKAGGVEVLRKKIVKRGYGSR
jgi:hypothetical protein